MILLSKDVCGKWAGILGVLFVVLMTLKIAVGFPLPTPAIALLGFIGLIMAVIAISKKDFAVLNFLALFVGLVVVLWFTAEMMYPH